MPPVGPRPKTQPTELLPEPEFAAKALRSLLVAVLYWAVPWVLIAIPLFVARKLAVSIASLFVILGTAVALWLLNRNRQKAASWTFLGMVWVISTWIVVFSGGIHSVALASQIAILVTAAWLLGRRTARWSWIFFLGYTLVLAVLELAGHPLPNYLPLAPIAAWMGLLLATAVTAVPLGQVLAYLNRSLQTAQRQLEEIRASHASLRESEARYRIIFESARDAIFVVDARSGLIRSANRAAVALLRRPAEEIEGTSYQDLPLDDWGFAQSVELSEYSGGTWEATLRLEDGHAVWVEVAAALMRGADDGRLVVAVVRDVSERKRAETERAALQEQLLLSQKLESLGLLAGGVAHDFNNLLTVINGYSDLCLMRLHESDPIRPQLEAVRSAGEEAAGVVKQLLTFSRKQVMQPKLIDCAELVRDHLDILRRLVREDIEFDVRLAPSKMRVRGDAVQLRQVVVNLILNARDAMPRGGRLVLETGEAELPDGGARVGLNLPPGSYVTVSVRDTGLGMSEETRQRIFEPFFTTKPQGSGTGLGLSMVYGVVRQCGGGIRVSSVPGEGSTFTTYLPCAGENEEVEAPEPVMANPLQGSGTILVVEDEDQVRRVTVAILRGLGYRVYEAESGEKALELVGQHGPSLDLVVTDMIMPKMTGRDLVEQIHLRIPRLPVLFVSGYPEVTGQDNDFELLQKPYQAEALGARVRDLLARRRAAGSE